MKTYAGTGLLTALMLFVLFLVACSAPVTPTPPQVTPPPTPPATTPTQPSQPGATTTPSAAPSPTTQPGGVAWSADGVVTPGEYSNELSQGSYRLFWSTTGDTIRMAMQADNQGWVAVGFQPGRRMKDADMVFGMMTGGNAVVQDHYSTGDFGPHTVDVQQGGTDDVLLYGGARTASTTTFEFERKLDTGDARDVALQRGVQMQIIWAYGSSDNERIQHSSRGYANIVP